MHKVLVNAPVNGAGLSCLVEAGFEPVVVSEWEPAASLRAAPDCAGMVANASLAIDDAFFALAKRLKVVGRMGVGYDNVDVEAATRHGVRVVNTPLPVIEPVAEHTFALLLALVRRIVAGDRDLRAGRFREPSNLPGPELRGKTLGLVGLGNTGRRVAEIARLGFGMELLYTDQAPRPETEAALGARRRSLDELLSESDFVSLHVNLSPATRKLIDRRALGLMKPSACLINVARGPVVDEEALVEALREGRIAGAGLDVFQLEPPAPEHPLWQLSNVVVTPHRAGASAESLHGCSMVVKDVIRVLRGEEPVHPVN
jgi:phosphoglycerate dehydrogenase-like enzyme